MFLTKTFPSSLFYYLSDISLILLIYTFSYETHFEFFSSYALVMVLSLSKSLVLDTPSYAYKSSMIQNPTITLDKKNMQYQKNFVVPLT